MHYDGGKGATISRMWFGVNGGFGIRRVNIGKQIFIIQRVIEK